MVIIPFKELYNSCSLSATPSRVDGQTKYTWKGGRHLDATICLFLQLVRQLVFEVVYCAGDLLVQLRILCVVDPEVHSQSDGNCRNYGNH